MRISLGDVTLWFDVSGPSVAPQGDTAIERPTLVAVHGGPGLDHINLRAELAPLAKHVQVLYYDQRGHGRSDHCTSEFWNLRTWAYDLRRLCDALGLVKPVVLGSSFGGHVALTYAGLFPGHPGGSKPGDAEELRQRHARSIQTTEVNRHYFRNEASCFNPWSVLGRIKSPVLILAGEDDPVCPLAIAEDLHRQLPADTTRLLRLPGARHTIFRDRPDIAFPAVEDFIRSTTNSEPADSPAD
jgi:pimeloyl-ACP methyl ester carboxylesterase